MCKKSSLHVHTRLLHKHFSCLTYSCYCGYDNRTPISSVQSHALFNLLTEHFVIQSLLCTCELTSVNANNIWTISRKQDIKLYLKSGISTYSITRASATMINEQYFYINRYQGNYVFTTKKMHVYQFICEMIIFQFNFDDCCTRKRKDTSFWWIS